MSLSSELISQFVKVTKDEKKTASETTVYGKTVEYNGSIYVQLDGSELLTPVSNTANIGPNERVMVMIKNHTATVTGNLTSPSARIITDEHGNQSVEGLNVDKIIDEIAEFEIIVADKVSSGELDAERGRIDALSADNVSIKERITANEGDIENLQTEYLTVTEKMSANEASIENLKTTKLDVEIADARYVSTEELEATNADIHNLSATYGEFASATADDLSAIRGSINDLETGKLSADSAALMYANIDFSNIGEAAIEHLYATSGLIENVVVSEGTITGRLVGVTISGDVIEGNTVIADKLVIQGEDGLYYKLNTDGLTTSAEQTDYNSLNGQVIQAKSITAEKVSVDDLVAFDATIGGFHITDNSIYSDVKDSEGNTTRGIYMDTDGQINFGDETNFVKYYKDDTGAYKLAISAESILYALNGKQHSIADIGMIGDYVHIGTYEDEPCIELGETDSDFRLIITNTRIMFMEGADVPAYINNQSLHIKKAVIEEELQQGNFVWRIRSNGNMGLVWKGEA